MVRANFTDGNNYTEAPGLTQWDYGQVLEIHGLDLPKAVEIHFAIYDCPDDAIIRIGNTVDKITRAAIPEKIMEQSQCAVAYVYVSDTQSGETVRTVYMPMTARQKPEAFDAPEDAEIFKETIEIVNAAADRAELAKSDAETARDVAQSTADETETARAEVEALKSQAQTAAESALLSEHNAKASETAAQTAQAGAETAEGQAELFAGQAEENKNFVEAAKAVVMELGQKVADDKSNVEQAVSDFEIARQNAVKEVKDAENAALENIGNGIDDTLTQSGKAADAKETGDKLSKLKDDLKNNSDTINEYFIFYPYLQWEIGSLSSTGISLASTTRIRSTKFYHLPKGTTFKLKSDSVKYRIYFYTGEDETTNIVDSMSGYWHTEDYTIPLDHENYAIKILVAYSNEATVVDVNALANAISIYIPPTVKDIIREISSLGSNLPILSASSDNMVSGDSLEIGNHFDFSKDTIQEFYAKITNFDSVTIGHGGARFMGNDVLIDTTKIQIRQGANSKVLKSVDHGLTISDFIYVLLEKDDKTNVKVTVMTSSGTFNTNCAGYYGVNGKIFASTTSTLTDAILKFTCKDMILDTYVFGDSYITLGDSSKYMTQLVNMGFADNLCLIGYGGESSENAIIGFRKIVQLRNPKRIIWGLGMNDGDSSSAVNSNWKTFLDEVKAYCANNGVELLLCTIPNTPTVINTFKNAVVKSSGYQYIDFAKAVNAESQGATWYNGMLSSNNVHPTELGAKVLASRFLLDALQTI